MRIFSIFMMLILEIIGYVTGRFADNVKMIFFDDVFVVRYFKDSILSNF